MCLAGRGSKFASHQLSASVYKRQAANNQHPTASEQHSQRSAFYYPNRITFQHAHLLTHPYGSWAAFRSSLDP